ncbi:hypothetical protein M758_4G075000 [Ceratodon purpureus]|nr:hypothetical protein M758_4G075000 [Ceratodon purpureus]
MCSCVAPIYVYLGSQLSTFFSSWTSWTASTKRLGAEPKADNGLKQLQKQPTLKSNVTFTYKELEVATAGFSKKNLIGVGGFAKVYKANLPDGRVVAVKKLFGRGKQSDREFRAEIETVGNCHHPNLVQLLGYCRTKDGKLLVYEFFENGSLNKYMRRNPGSKEANLDWDNRLTIALGAAEGLAYLHNRDPRIIHRDVKASNILLDRNFEAKVSDFGLARLIDPAKTHVTTFIAGTKAYIAPEYQKSLRLTVKCDVYSYGVVLLELLTGKDPSMGRNFDIIAWVKRRMGSTPDFFDVRMLDSGDKDANKVAMTKALYLALDCTKTSPHQRPTMDEVVAQLKSLQKPVKPWEDEAECSESSSLQDHHSSLRPVAEDSSGTQTSSVVTSGAEDDVFPGKTLDIPFERPYMVRVVSTPILSEALKGADDTRAVVTIEDIRLESQQCTLGLEDGDSLPFSSGTNSRPSPSSADYIHKDHSRNQSF